MSTASEEDAKGLSTQFFKDFNMIPDRGPKEYGENIENTRFWVVERTFSAPYEEFVRKTGR